MKRRIFLAFFSCLAFATLATLPAIAKEPPQEQPSLDLNAIFAGREAPESLDALRAMEKRQQELAKRVREVTVGLRIGHAQGSGVIVSKDGLVLTAAHVAQSPNLDVMITLPDGSEVTGKTLGMNREIDSGMIKITAERQEGWPYAPLGDYKAVHPGQWVMTTGHPGGYIKGRRPVVRVGRVVSKRSDYLVTDCPLVGGDSGGPLFDMQGRVIGIHSRIGEELVQNIHVPVSTYQDTWERLAKGEIWGRLPRTSAYIGVQGDPNVQQEAEGALIVKVTPGEAADEAGIRPGDLIIRFGRRPIKSFTELVDVVGRRQPGDEVRVRVRRGDEEIDLEMKIGQKN